MKNKGSSLKTASVIEPGRGEGLVFSHVLPAGFDHSIMVLCGRELKWFGSDREEQPSHL